MAQDGGWNVSGKEMALQGGISHIILRWTCLHFLSHNKLLQIGLVNIYISLGLLYCSFFHGNKTKVPVAAKSTNSLFCSSQFYLPAMWPAYTKYCKTNWPSNTHGYSYKGISSMSIYTLCWQWWQTLDIRNIVLQFNLPIELYASSRYPSFLHI